MTNNTIPNVPRELLAELQEHIDCHRDAVLWGKVCDLLSTTSPTDHVEDVRAMVAAPSPAGVDGLEVVGTVATMGFGRHCISADFTACDKLKVGDPVTAMLPAQAIIDGLRGEVDKLMTTFVRVADHLHIDCEKAKSAPGKPSDVFIAAIDQQAQRIGELEGLLRHAQKQVPTGSGLHMRIDAALSAVCAAAPNIATTSEHSGS